MNDIIKSLLIQEGVGNVMPTELFYDVRIKTFVCCLAGKYYYWREDKNNIPLSDWVFCKDYKLDLSSQRNIDPYWYFKTNIKWWSYYTVLSDKSLYLHDTPVKNSEFCSVYNPKDGIIYQCYRIKLEGLIDNNSTYLTKDMPDKLRSIYCD